MIVSSSVVSVSTRMMPLRSNCHATVPGVPSEPPCLEKMWRTSDAARLRLSVTIRHRIATPPGPYPS